MRAVWSGSIGFGLVNIPVKIYSAVQDSRLDMDMLDRKTGDNIIKAKASGKKIIIKKMEIADTKQDDLFEQLRASLSTPLKKRAS